MSSKLFLRHQKHTLRHAAGAIDVLSLRARSSTDARVSAQFEAPCSLLPGMALRQPRSPPVQSSVAAFAPAPRSPRTRGRGRVDHRHPLNRLPRLALQLGRNLQVSRMLCAAQKSSKLGSVDISFGPEVDWTPLVPSARPACLPSEAQSFASCLPL
ncbi:hypothetical protein PHLGIDRAFT_164361 [Phlebiopsis gigantea 11061_1 CR5-6]|uniref:Uncharacterized protein n=1 Tax=Phlebiopsis gigantea (strain 11061_1 CR5-6) TaxID=745531 RepID=A0A0C3RVC1_PHLG1|nr:hypothetical protein PHLGIDRAFT_164361 [Phlebiopsis gigantea 11061_1 CR5-6]